MNARNLLEAGDEEVVRTWGVGGSGNMSDLASFQVEPILPMVGGPSMAIEVGWRDGQMGNRLGTSTEILGPDLPKTVIVSKHGRKHRLSDWGIELQTDLRELDWIYSSNLPKWESKREPCSFVDW